METLILEFLLASNRKDNLGKGVSFQAMFWGQKLFILSSSLSTGCDSSISGHKNGGGAWDYGSGEHQSLSIYVYGSQDPGLWYVPGIKMV